MKMFNKQKKEERNECILEYPFIIKKRQKEAPVIFTGEREVELSLL